MTLIYGCLTLDFLEGYMRLLHDTMEYSPAFENMIDIKREMFLLFLVGIMVLK